MQSQPIRPREAGRVTAATGDCRRRQVEQQTRDTSRWAQSGQQWSGSRWSGNWNRDWRNDRRYDWRRYRDNHRSIFRIGIYYDPFGYGYQPFDIGYQLSPAYFGQQYWIDPGMYQLPYPPPGTTLGALLERRAAGRHVQRTK